MRRQTGKRKGDRQDVGVEQSSGEETEERKGDRREKRRRHKRSRGGEAEEMRGNRQEKGNETGEECIQSRAEETNKGVERRGNRQGRGEKTDRRMERRQSSSAE